jgi:hypothetical protein
VVAKVSFWPPEERSCWIRVKQLDTFPMFVRIHVVIWGLTNMFRITDGTEYITHCTWAAVYLSPKISLLGEIL